MVFFGIEFLGSFEAVSWACWRFFGRSVASFSLKTLLLCRAFSALDAGVIDIWGRTWKHCATRGMVTVKYRRGNVDAAKMREGWHHG